LDFDVDDLVGFTESDDWDLLDDDGFLSENDEFADEHDEWTYYFEKY
jgi:hypothetical protein